jgi:hypothetical protein
MGFIQQLLQNQQQQQTLPQQSAQSRFGQSGLLESLRNIQPPTLNLPSQAQGSPSGGGMFGGLQGLLEQLRQQSGQQGLGGMMPRPQQPQPQMPQRPLVHPIQNTGGVQMPGFNPTPQRPINITQMPGYTPTGPSMAPPSGFNPTPRMPSPTVNFPGGGSATGDPRPPSPTQPSAPTQVQSRYGSLSGMRRPGMAR